MPRAWSHTNRQSGFSLVEVLLAATVFGMLVTALVGAVIYGRTSTGTAGTRARASLIAEEGLEAVRNIRDGSFAGIANGTYGLAQTGNQWVLSGTQDTTDVYTRQIIVGSGTDANRKTVTSRVSWPQGATTAQVEVTTQLANWMAAIAVPKSWANASVGGSLDAAGTNNATKVAVSGNYAYVVRADGTPDFLVVNISNPAAPTLAGSLSLTGIPTNIAVSGNYAYVTNSDNSSELQTINVTNPAAPTLSNTYNASGTADSLGVYVSGTYAYVVRGANAGVAEFLIMNLATPGTPTLSGSYANNNTMREVYVNGNYAYVATDIDTQELLVVNVTSKTTPTLAGSFNLSATTNALTIDGYDNRVFIGQGTSVFSMNVSTPTAPTQAGSVVTTGTGVVQDIDVDQANNLLFVGSATTTAEFQVLNVATPTAMTIVDTVDVSGISLLSGVAFQASANVVVGATASDTQEVITFIQN
jgi:prepilin-type N-terminal cleavage/methylation domain-containing protein